MKINNIREIDREELYALPFSTSEIIGKEYDNIIIIPTDDMHPTGFRCMKYILLTLKRQNVLDVVGVVGGYSDVIHFISAGCRASIDCLPCGYLRIILEEPATVPCFIGSDFFIERREKENEAENN